MTLPQFLQWLERGNTAMPVSIYESAPPANERRSRFDEALAVLYGPGGVYP